jgi:hypothetical protein
MTQEILKYLLDEANILEARAVDAVKNGQISLNDFHHMSLIALEYLHEQVTPVFGRNQELAFALALGRVCAEEIRNGVKDNDITYSINALRLGNIGFGIAKRIEVDIHRQKEKARNAANTRHSKTAAHKQMVWDYYQQESHIFKSLDQAAEKISSKKEVPFAFRTVRKWIAEFNQSQKKLPPA